MPIDDSQVQWDDDDTAGVPRIEIRGTSRDVPDESKVTWDDAAPSLRDTIEDVASRYWTGVKGGAARMRDELFPPVNPVSMFTKTGGEQDAETRARKAGLAAYEANKAQLGLPGTLGDLTPELGLSAVPIARTGEVIAALPTVAKTFGRLAPAMGDLAANAGYEAGKAAPSGDPATAAALGGGGAAAGRLLTRTLGGLRPLVSQEAGTLLDAGITPTWGQMLGPVAEKAEGAASAIIPGFGASVDAARTRAARQYVQHETNRALEPLGATVTESAGDKAIRQANDLIDNSYENLKSRTFMTPDAALTALLRTETELQHTPLLTDAQRQQVVAYMRSTILPETQRGGNISGEVAKDLDSKIGALARKYSRSANASDAPLGDGFYTLQQQLRSVLQGSDADAVDALRATDAAYRNMIPVNKAADAAARKKGVFDPVQFAKKGGTGDVNEAARDVMDLSTGGGLSSLVRGGVNLSAAHLTSPLTAAGIYAGGRLSSAALYSDLGAKMVLKGMNLMPHISNWVASLPPDRQMEFIARMANEIPSVHQLVAQIGRQLASSGAQP
jgi:hypothetical protein